MILIEINGKTRAFQLIGGGKSAPNTITFDFRLPSVAHSNLKTTYLTVVRAVTTRQEAWVENHIYSFSKNASGDVVDRRRKTRVHFVHNLTGVNQYSVNHYQES